MPRLDSVRTANLLGCTTAYSGSPNLTGTIKAPLPVNRIERINVGNATYDIAISDDAFAEAMKKYMEKYEPKFYRLTCQSCGASIDQKLDDHIFKCPYCKQAYAVGTKMINAR